MLHNKQKVICHTLIIAVTIVTIVLVGSSYSYSSVFAFPFQSAIHHHKVFDKKQASDSNSKEVSNGGSSDNSDRASTSNSDRTLDHRDDSSSDSSSSTSDTRSSDNLNNLGNSDNNNKNNDQGTNDGSNTDTDNNLQAIEHAKTDELARQGTGENVASIGTATPTPHATCEQGSNCTDQQGLSDHDRSTTATTTTGTKQDDNTPFILSLPFP